MALHGVLKFNIVNLAFDSSVGALTEDPPNFKSVRLMSVAFKKMWLCCLDACWNLWFASAWFLRPTTIGQLDVFKMLNF